MAEEWVGVIETTAPKYIKGAIDNTMRKRLLLAMLQARGRISYGNSGQDLRWDIMFRQPPVSSYGDGQTIVYQRSDVYRQLKVDWRGYMVSDMMTLREKEMNKGTEAIVDRYARILPNQMKSLQDEFGTELYIDGNAANNENRLHGLDTFCGYTACAANDLIAQPNDNYADKATNLGTLGGTWSNNTAGGSLYNGLNYPNAALTRDWPNGVGDTEYDYLAPKLLNTVGAWSTATQNWSNHCELIIRQALIWSSSTFGVSGSPGLVLMAQEFWAQFLNKISSRLNIWSPHKEAEDLGFPQALNFDGAALQFEYGVPANTAYGINLEEMELCSLQSELFTSTGPTYDPHTHGHLFLVGFMGNAKYNPKAFFKCRNFTS